MLKANSMILYKQSLSGGMCVGDYPLCRLCIHSVHEWMSVLKQGERRLREVAASLKRLATRCPSNASWSLSNVRTTEWSSSLTLSSPLLARYAINSTLSAGYVTTLTADPDCHDWLSLHSNTKCLMGRQIPKSWKEDRMWNRHQNSIMLCV